MNVLIVYGTTEGQTPKIAEWTATYIRDREHHVDLRDSVEPMSDLQLGLFHAFIIAASVHQQYHQETIANFFLGGALRFSEYDYFQEQIVKFIVMKEGGAEPGQSNHEFTDWKALAGFVDMFLERAAHG